MNTEEAHPICHPDYVISFPDCRENVKRCDYHTGMFEVFRDKITGDQCAEDFHGCHCTP